MIYIWTWNWPNGWQRELLKFIIYIVITLLFILTISYIDYSLFDSSIGPAIAGPTGNNFLGESFNLTDKCINLYEYIFRFLMERITPVGPEGPIVEGHFDDLVVR